MTPLLNDHTRSGLEAITGSKATSYIFHGPQSVGKATAALHLARRLNCQGDKAGLCGPCRQFEANSYPDYLILRREDKPSILIEQVRAIIQALSLSPYYQTGTRMVLIDGADTMTVEAQNALLKLIEEPPPQTLFVLAAERLSALLPTVRSRCLQIHFLRSAISQIAALLTDHHGVEGPRAAELAAAADGAPGLAIRLAAHPEEAAAHLEFARAAAVAPTLGAFERLLLATRLVATGADLTRFTHLLHNRLTTQLRAGDPDTPAIQRRLEALERHRQHSQAKVAPRVALERLMLEL